MASSGRMRPPGGGAADEQPQPDFPLSRDDTNLLQDALTDLFSTEDRARALLRNAGFPSRGIPTFSDPYSYWTDIFFLAANGVMDAPYRQLIGAAIRVYGTNRVLNDLVSRYTGAPNGQAAAPVEPEPPAQPEQTCHVVFRINSEEERGAIETWLTGLDLAPRQMWSTISAVSYQLNNSDPNRVRERLVTRGDLGWALVPPGEPDYLLRQLFVEGPDGRRFRVSDIPVQSTVSALAAEVVDRYPEGMPGADRPTVVDHVAQDGTGRRMNPDRTLHEEGIRENDQVRVGFQRTAAAVNPLDRRDALYRVRNQLQEYVNAHPEVTITANSAVPTEYDVEFIQPGFGPPDPANGEPTDISEHALSIVLGPEFPVTAPRVLWNSEIFHPNVYPTYDSEALRQRPSVRGLVCLGTLADSYQPSLDFGDLCVTLRDIAGYRNYSVVVPADDSVDPRTGEPLLRGDFYDEQAALWAISTAGQRRILAIGGAPVLRQAGRGQPRYGYDIELDT